MGHQKYISNSKQRLRPTMQPIHILQCLSINTLGPTRNGSQHKQ
jgi:hypothetical protein